jgi:hypothetical protein
VGGACAPLRELADRLAGVAERAPDWTRTTTGSSPNGPRPAGGCRRLRPAPAAPAYAITAVPLSNESERTHRPDPRDRWGRPAAAPDGTPPATASSPIASAPASTAAPLPGCREAAHMGAWRNPLLSPPRGYSRRTRLQTRNARTAGTIRFGSCCRRQLRSSPMRCWVGIVRIESERANGDQRNERVRAVSAR